MNEKNGTLKLSFVWGLRLKLRSEGNKLWAEGEKLWAEGEKLSAEGEKLSAEGEKLWAEGDKLWAEGNKLWAEGNKLWAEGILEAYGNITLEWQYREAKLDFACVLENGEVFEP